MGIICQIKHSRNLTKNCSKLVHEDDDFTAFRLIQTSNKYVIYSFSSYYYKNCIANARTLLKFDQNEGSNRRPNHYQRSDVEVLLLFLKIYLRFFWGGKIMVH